MLETWIENQVKRNLSENLCYNSKSFKSFWRLKEIIDLMCRVSHPRSNLLALDPRPLAQGLRTFGLVLLVLGTRSFILGCLYFFTCFFQNSFSWFYFFK
jgi:hypothetical protein